MARVQKLPRRRTGRAGGESGGRVVLPWTVRPPLAHTIFRISLHLFSFNVVVSVPRRVTPPQDRSILRRVFKLRSCAAFCAAMSCSPWCVRHVVLPFWSPCCVRHVVVVVLPCCAAMLCCHAVLPWCAAMVCCHVVLPCCAAFYVRRSDFYQEAARRLPPPTFPISLPYFRFCEAVSLDMCVLPYNFCKIMEMLLKVMQFAK